MRGCVMVISAAMLVVGAAGAGEREVKRRKKPWRPEIWMCPNAEHILDLVEQKGRWDDVRKRLAGLKLYIGTLNKAPEDKLRLLAALIHANRFKVVVECAGCGNHDWGDEAGEKTAEVELRAFRRWAKLGGRIDYLDMDGPVRRLMGHAGWGKDESKKFTSYERCAVEVVDYMRGIRKEFPRMGFFLLTNFPNWGYKGEVSYHARGEKRQDWGDYDEVAKAVIKVTRASRMPLSGVTVDNPYEYLTGEHKSVKLGNPKEVDWPARVRAYEDFAHEQRLEFNLIVNSEEGGKTSDEEFFARTMKMVEAYDEAGGCAERLFIQSWYDYPKTIVPEKAGHSMTALVKAVMEKLR